MRIIINSEPMSNGKCILGIIVGIAFVALFGKALMNRAEESSTLDWVETPCVVIDSSLMQQGSASGLSITYEYIEGTKRKGTGWIPAESWNEATKKSRDCIGTTSTCYVHPYYKNQSSLKQTRELVIDGTCLFLVTFFIAGCCSILLGVIGLRFKKDLPTSSPRKTFLPKSFSLPWLIASIIGLLILASSLWGLLRLTIEPWMERADAQKNWQQLTANISWVATGEESGRTPEFLYSYDVADKEYSSSRYCFGLSNHGFSRKQLARMAFNSAEGESIKIYVNPSAPYAAVIDRNALQSITISLLLLIPATIGLIIVAVVCTRVKSFLPQNKRTHCVFKSHRNRIRHLNWSLLLTVIWLLACTSLIYQKNYPAEAEIVIFLSLLLPLSLLIYRALDFRNPKFTLKLDCSELTLGKKINIDFSCTRNLKKLETFHIYLRGREEAVYRKGTKTLSKNSIFLTLDILSNPSSLSPSGQRQLSVTIPSNTMHSFYAVSNAVSWYFEIKAQVKRGPDIGETFGVHVAPRPKPSGGLNA